MKWECPRRSRFHNETGVGIHGDQGGRRGILSAFVKEGDGLVVQIQIIPAQVVEDAVAEEISSLPSTYGNVAEQEL